MKKRFISIVSLMICVLMAFSVMSGCGSKPAEPAATTAAVDTTQAATESTAPAVDNSEFKIDWYINLNWWKWGGDYGNDLLSKELTKKTGAVINFITPAGDPAQQITTMIASGTLPDMVTVESWLDYKTKMAKAGLVVPFNDLMDKHAPKLLDYVKEDVFNWYQEGDGKTYCTPNYAYSQFNMKAEEKLSPNGDFVVRQDLLEKIGNPDITSPDQLLAALEKIKTEVKEYNGKPLIPLQIYDFSDRANASFHWLSQFYSVPFEDEQGNWIYTKTHPKFFQVMKFLNAAVQKGYISKDNFTDKRDQINEKVASGRVFALLAASQDFGEHMKTLYRADNKAVYVAKAIKNYDGDEPYLQDLRGFGWLVTLISKSSKVPDRCIRLLEFLNSPEGQILCNFGVEGETFTMKEATNQVGETTKIPVMTDGYKEEEKAGTAAKKYGLGFMAQNNWLFLRTMYEAPKTEEDKYLTYIKDPLKPYSYDFNASGLKLDPTDPRYDKAKEIDNKIELYYGKQVVKMMLAKSEAECKAIFDETCAKIKEMGFDEMYTFYNEGFQRAKKALGQEHSWPGLLKK